MRDLDQARDLSKDSADVAVDLSWQHSALVFNRCPNDYDAELALSLARIAVEDKPLGNYQQLALGWARYRQRRFGEAHEALLRAAELRTPKPEPWDLFALAMTEWQLGRKSEARDSYDRGVTRMNETYPRFPEYILLRGEAAELLGIQPQ